MHDEFFKRLLDDVGDLVVVLVIPDVLPLQHDILEVRFLEVLRAGKLAVRALQILTALRFVFTSVAASSAHFWYDARNLSKRPRQLL